MLNTLVQRWIALILYLCVDVMYVMSSRAYYSEEVRKVQGSPMMVGPEKIWAAFGSYLLLAIGWFVLVAPWIEKLKSWKMAAYYGMIYGFVVYGVFNLTNFVMFKNYSISMVLRDTIWGVSWLTIFSMLYHIFVTGDWRFSKGV